MEALNSYILYDSVDVAKHDEGWLVRGHGYQHPTECIKCGACEEACPQSIDIIHQLERFVDAVMPEKKNA